ncbi:putative nucleotidyltransferase [Rhizobium sp. PP-F2F-G36]|nr:putative nucleotidyltransferase [Rhizobium sp. PP-F2F-G36]
MNHDRLGHLPENKRRELARVTQILFEEFEDKLKGKLTPEKKLGRILKVILFGSYARGDWVEDRDSGYRSDYDLLIIVNNEDFTDLHDYWDKADERFIRDLSVTNTLDTPVNFIVHSLMDVNDQLARGRPFFSDIVRDGVVLYEMPGYPFATHKPLSVDVARSEAQKYFDKWFARADHRFDLAQTAIMKGYANEAAFDLHQAVERLYHCTLLVLTLYSPKSHRINVLRSHAENLDARLMQVWPRDTRFSRRAFSRLRRAYVEARYSSEYEITPEEIVWLVERVKLLQETVATICSERLRVGPESYSL